MMIGPEGTIYEDETRFDNNLEIDINLQKIKFIEVLKTSEALSIFHVYYNSKSCVLKVVCPFRLHPKPVLFLTMT